MRPSAGIGVFVFSSTVVLGGMTLFAGASGCTVLTNDSLPDDAGKFEGGDATTQTCPTCLGQECTGQWAACLTDPACTALAKRATSATCEADGGATDSGTADGGADPLALYGAFSACGAAKAGAGAACASDCTGTSQPAPCATDGGVVDSGTGDASDDAATTDAGDDAGDAGADADADADAGTTAPATPTVDGCTSCVSGKCGDAKKACAIGSECASYLECTFAAADAAAAEDCGRQFATGKTAAVELATCTRVGCSDACGF